MNRDKWTPIKPFYITATNLFVSDLFYSVKQENINQNLISHLDLKVKVLL